MKYKFAGPWLLLLSLAPVAFPAAPGPRWPLEKALYEVNLDYYPNHSFRELAADVPRLKQLGINVLYIMPFFESAPGARYLITDYYKIDPRYGTPGDLKHLVRTAHQHGIRVLLDLVTSLTHDESWIYKQRPDWILKGDNGERQRFYPFKDWGWALDCAHPEVIGYYSQLARYYVQEYDIDGWRIDSPMNNYDPAKVSSDHSRVKLLRAVKAAMREVKKDVICVCELSGPTLMWGKDDSDEQPLYDEICEASYNFELCGFFGGKKETGFHYIFFEGSPAFGKLKLTLFDKVLHAQASSRELVDAIRGQPILYGASRANFIENHDTERISWAFPKRHRALFTLIATMPGVPVVHAGQEIGTANPAGHFERKPKVSNTIPWHDRDHKLEAFYRTMLGVRESNPALIYGDVRDILLSGDRPYAYLRSHRDNRVAVLINMTGKPAKAAVNLLAGESGSRAASGYTVRNLLDGQVRHGKASELSNFSCDLEPYGIRVLRVEGSPGR